jgi:hypothetical protein
MEDLAKNVAHLEADLVHYKAKSESDDEMITVLKRQNETQAMEMEKMSFDHANEIRRLKQRCDLAVQRETGITGILNTAAKGIVEGMRRMKGDEAREIQSAQEVGTARPVIAAPAPEPGPAVGPDWGTEDRAGTSGAEGIRNLLKRLPQNEFVPRAKGG